MVAPGGLSGFRAAPDRRELVVYKAEPVAAQIPTITHQGYPGPDLAMATRRAAIAG